MPANIPAYYDHKNYYNSSFAPSTVHCNTGLSSFFQKYLLQKAMSVFEWEAPAPWNMDYFLYTLYMYGYIAIVNTDKFGVIPQACGLQGYDVFYAPTNAIVTNPLLSGMLHPRIGTECTVIKLQPTYSGVMDIVTYYGDQLALCAQALGVNLINSKFSYVFGAENKANAETFKKLYDKIASGEPCAVVDKDLFDQQGRPRWIMFEQDVKSNYIVSDLLSDMRKLEERFDMLIGIPTVNSEKRERLIVDEANANNVETQALSDVWFEHLEAGCKQASEMFGIKLSVKRRYKGGAEYGDTFDTGSDESDPDIV